jgi:putative FmdB family regulatory protein
MPLFEYACRNCSERFETLVLARVETRCPRCGSSDLEKLLSTFAARTHSGAGSGACPASGGT